MINWTEVEKMYQDIRNGLYTKSINETGTQRIVIYKCGTIIRIDIKETLNETN